MRILFLDDNPTRHRRADTLLEGHQLQHVWSVDEACKALVRAKSSRRPFHRIFLDHDLNDHGVKSYIRTQWGIRLQTGMDVVRFIVEQIKPMKSTNLVIVHSSFPPGAKAMVDELRSKGFNTIQRRFYPIYAKDWA